MQPRSNLGGKKRSRVVSQHRVPLPQASNVMGQLSSPLSLTIGVKVRSKGRFTASNCSNANPTGVLDLTCYDIGSLLEVHELCTQDDAEPPNRGKLRPRI